MTTSISELMEYHEKLLSLMQQLKSSTEDVKWDPRMAGWLQIVMNKESEVEEIEKEISKAQTIYKFDYRAKLCKRIVSCISELRKLISSKDAPSNAIEAFVSSLAIEYPHQFSSAQLKKCTGDFSDILGSGGFGVVYKGQLADGVPVAIKVLKRSLVDILESQFKAEIVTMGRTHHRNLLRLHGYCFDDRTKALVYEYMENGTFETILSKNHLSLMNLYNIAISIAKGISYLHDGCNPQIIHFDIKPANVLLDADFCPKIADFGLSVPNRDMSEFTEAGIRGSRGYVAPEMTQLEPRTISCKCDVYSFGMILFDILGSKRKCVTERWLPGEIWEKFQQNQLDNFIKDCGIEKLDEVKQAKTLATVALYCSEHVPENRPSMSRVVRMLEGEMQPWKPVNPFPSYDPSTENSTIGGSRY